MRVSAWVGFLMVAALLMGASPAAAGMLQGTVETEESLGFDGETTGATASGLLQLASAPASPSVGTLEAENVTVSYTWLKTYDVGRENRDAVLEVERERGSETVNLTRVSANLTAAGGTQELLAIATSPASRLSARGTGSSTAESVENATVVSVGHSAGSRTVGNISRVGFSYTVDGPWPGIDGFDSGIVRGDFLVFVHNMTLTGASAEEEHWRHWTGERSREGPSPGVEEHELRVTVIEVTNGTLWLSARDALRLIGPDTDVTVEGAVTGSSVKGTLHGAQRVFELSEAQLELVGEGSAMLTGRPGQGQAQGVVTTDSTPRLVADIEGGFEVRDSPGVETRSVASGPASGLTDAWPWLLGVAAAAAVLYVSRHRIAERLYKHKANRRNDRTTRWMQTGDRLFEMREFEAALDWYQRIVDAYPNSIEGWDSVAAVHRELEAYEEAADAYETVSELLNGDAPSLAQAAACAWRAGQDERAVKLAVTAGRSDAGTLARRIDGPAFEGLREHPEVRKVLGREDPGGGTSASYV